MMVSVSFLFILLCIAKPVIKIIIRYALIFIPKEHKAMVNDSFYEIKRERDLRLFDYMSIISLAIGYLATLSNDIP